jgi:thiamine pyrophosphate-dependent acetolactate synthase large subunit-like protein
MLLSTNKRFNELYGYFNKGIQALLKWWGDADQVMTAYIRAIEDKEQRDREEKERRTREERERIRRE